MAVVSETDRGVDTQSVEGDPFEVFRASFPDDEEGDRWRELMRRLKASPDKRLTLNLQIPNTAHFLRARDSRNLMTTTAVAALTDLCSHNVPLTVAAVGLWELAHRYERLTEEEMAVFDVLRALAQGGSIYKVWIAEDDLLAAIDPEMDRDDRRRLLANMKSRGILEEGAGKWRAVW
jgi:hypothetical protein